MQINFNDELNFLSKNLNEIGNAILSKSTRLAQNRAIDKCRTTANLEIRKQANVKKADLDKKIKTSYASNTKPYASIDLKQARATNLIHYVRGDITRFRKRNKDGTYSAKSKRGVAARPYERTKYHKGAFVARGINSGKQLVFKRKYEGRRSKLEVIHGPSFRTIFKQGKTQQAIEDRARKEFPIELRRAVNFTLREMKRVKR
jgi:hypothetical protein